MAEKKGFEPLIPLWGIHDFQSCALDQLRDFSVFAQVNMLFNYQLGYYNSQPTQSQAFFCSDGTFWDFAVDSGVITVYTAYIQL